MIESFSESIYFEPGCCLGGNAADTMAQSAPQPLELNGISIDRGLSGEFTIATIDALYSGEMATNFGSKRNIFCASHTHYAPMIDANKHLLGGFSNKSFSKWKSSFKTRSLKNIAVDDCQFFMANVDAHIYRRLDYPRHSLNKFLNSKVGLFPNDSLKFDRSIYVWLFRAADVPCFAFVYHAGHPVSRHRSLEISADYIAAIRSTIRLNWPGIPVLFFQGCGADLRPRILGKRNQFLPRFWLNKKFISPPSLEEEDRIDEMYKNAIHSLQKIKSFDCVSSDFTLKYGRLGICGQEDIVYPKLSINKNFEFHFLPFEMSHLFHLLDRQGQDYRFLVSCSGDTKGYLPHPLQLPFGGYEVDASRRFMSLKERLKIESAEFLIV